MFTHVCHCNRNLPFLQNFLFLKKNHYFYLLKLLENSSSSSIYFGSFQSNDWNQQKEFVGIDGDANAKYEMESNFLKKDIKTEQQRICVSIVE